MIIINHDTHDNKEPRRGYLFDELTHLPIIMFGCKPYTLLCSALYYAEMDVEKTSFDSIPASCWWAVVTVTTLGYGDMCPNTAIGKIMGTLCVFSGILVIAFQMPIMVAKVGDNVSYLLVQRFEIIDFYKKPIHTSLRPLDCIRCSQIHVITNNWSRGLTVNIIKAAKSRVILKN